MNITETTIISIVTAAATAITALGTAFVAFWGYWRKARAELESELQRRFNEKKWEVYTEFTKFLHRYMADSPNHFDGSMPATTADDLIPLSSQITLIGSDKVVEAHSLWRQAAKDLGPGEEATRQLLYKLVVEMRRDLGNQHTKLEYEELLKSLA